MAEITKKDRERIDEPCKFCYYIAPGYGRGKNKKFLCKACNGLLMENPDNYTFSQLPDCPQRKQSK